MAKRPTARARASRASSGKPTSTAPSTPSTPSSTALANLASDYQTSAFALQPSKRDKRHIRHGQLLARVREGGISKNNSGNGTAKAKTRRPSKKLKTDLGDIANALDDVEMEEEEEEEEVEEESRTGNRKGGGEKSGVYAEDEWEGVSETSEQQEGVEKAGKVRRRRRQAAASTDGKMVMKSLKHRPGSMKRKKALEEREMERFKRNLAQLAKAEGASGQREGAGGGQDEHIQQRWKALRAFIGGTLVKDKAFEGV